MIEIRVSRPLFYQGARREADAVLSVPELDAADLLASRRAELVIPGELAAVRAAIATRNVELCPVRTRAESPWRRVA